MGCSKRNKSDIVPLYLSRLVKSQMTKCKLLKIVPMKRLTYKEELDIQTTKNCYICEKPFKNNDIRCRDHNHKNSHVIPVIFHNLSGYDSHFLIKELCTSFK